MEPDPFILEVWRQTDLLVLRFKCYKLEATENGRLKRSDPTAAASVVVEFPPQYIGEAAFPNESLPPAPVTTRLSGESRLAFRLPDDVPDVPLTLDALLDWNAWIPLLGSGALADAAAVPADQPPPQMPGQLETAIEFPLCLLLSPDAGAKWRHDIRPVIRDDAVELWQSRLSSQRGEGCRISSYLQTMANQGYNPLVAIQMALSGQIYAQEREYLPLLFA